MQSIFRRYEKKYLITRDQHLELEKAISSYMMPDHYGEYLVQNLYFDTESWDVIRTSIEGPAYKEKMRLRCYGNATHKSIFYLELKKKYKGVVYKRRIAIPSYLFNNRSIRALVSKTPSQIASELDFYLRSNDVDEKIYIAYQRHAFMGIEDGDLRITFDRNLRFRLDNLKFSNPNTAQTILPQDKTLMEVKTLGGMPLWLAKTFSENEIFPTSFSKFGICYSDYICKNTISCERKVQTIA